LEIALTPPDAELFVDGVSVGSPTTLELSLRPHVLYVERQGFAPHGELLDVGGAPRVRIAMLPVGPQEELGALRLRAEDGADPSERLMAAAAHLFSVDALAIVQTLKESSRLLLVINGPALGRADAISAAAGDLTALRDAAARVGAAVRAECLLEHHPPERGRAGMPLVLGARAGACLVGLRASYRVNPGAWMELSAPFQDHAARVTIPGAALPRRGRPYVLEYQLWGETAATQRSNGFGNASVPERVLIDSERPPSPPRWYRKWWVWTIVGGVATAAAVATVLTVIRPPSEAILVRSR
jgi:hypothetical protein